MMLSKSQQKICQNFTNNNKEYKLFWHPNYSANETIPEIFTEPEVLSETLDNVRFISYDVLHLSYENIQQYWPELKLLFFFDRYINCKSKLVI